MVLAEILTVPRPVEALLLDLDGTIADMSGLHQAAWKAVFGSFLDEWRRQTGRPARPLRFPSDYHTYLDGRSRTDGVAAVLASRRISVPWGSPGDSPATWSVWGLSNRKTFFLDRALHSTCPTKLPDADLLIEEAVRRGIPLAVVSSSRHAERVLERVGLRGHFSLVVSGPGTQPGCLRGKPAPDLFLAAANRLGVPPRNAVVVEDSAAGVRAGRAGEFGLVVGVDRGGRAETLRSHGADVVVADLADLRALLEVPVLC